MRVLLFVQTFAPHPKFPDGDDRVKCVKQFGDRVGWAREYFSKIRFGEDGQPRRGWLVACRNAEEGRVCVNASNQAVMYGPSATVHIEFWTGVANRHGRILASGGRGE